jgi:hypothetical protein
MASLIQVPGEQHGGFIGGLLATRIYTYEYKWDN